MLYSSYPKVVDPDSSPYQDTLAYQDSFKKADSSDAYTTQADYSLSDFFDTDSLIERPFSSNETMFPDFPTGLSFNSTLPATGIAAAENQTGFRRTFSPAPFGQPEQYQIDYAFDPASINSEEPVTFSPLTQSSRTPSLCGDGQQQDETVSSWLSPRQIKRESTLLDDETIAKRPQRKRGRPRLEYIDAGPLSLGSSPTKGQRVGRLSHNQVERKYREGLNSELERLRKAVPTLPQSEDGGGMGRPKPSKAMVLTGAIEYIKRIEKERDDLLDEIDRLKQAQRQSTGWNQGNDCLEDFLIDL